MSACASGFRRRRAATRRPAAKRYSIQWKRLSRPDAAGDEEAAQEDGAGYSPEEDARLLAGGDAKEAEEEQEDEEVVERERLLEGIAGEVLGCACCVVDAADG